MPVNEVTPALMLAVAVAICVDYHLFLLSRLIGEIRSGRELTRALDASLRTAGRIVLVSGTCLMLSFASMVSLPVDVLQSMGLAAAATTLLAVLITLTLTPALLLR